MELFKFFFLRGLSFRDEGKSNSSLVDDDDLQEDSTDIRSGDLPGDLVARGAEPSEES